MTIKDVKDAILGILKDGLLKETALSDPGSVGLEFFREAIEKDLDDIRCDKSTLMAVTAGSALFTVDGHSSHYVIGYGVRRLIPEGEAVKYLEPMDRMEFNEWVDMMQRVALEGGRDTDALNYSGTICWAPGRGLLIGWEGDRDVEDEFEVSRIMFE